MKDELTKRRLEDLAQKSYKGNHYTFTSFLTEAELSEFYEIKHISPSDYTVFGGRPDAERVMIRFGNPEEFGYTEEFPLKCVIIEPISKKFAEALTHRDFLGCLMNLGIKRSEIGDIIVEEKAAYVFCTDKMADYICSEITRVRHTVVSCSITENLPSETQSQRTELEIQAASERIDGVISKVFHISRSGCSELFREKKIFVNGRGCENSSYILKENDKVSVRGFGKFIYICTGGTTRKGNRILKIEKF
ncbi:MAG: YlmH/Sll1252 family protein [Oscillospiraceae bacterium]|nr:YlmH/Sll1252 family protein [Oscillospiraceae bacterium]